MADGGNDIGELFNRVTALEQDELSTEFTLVNIIKSYQHLGVRSRVKIYLHQYPIAGDQNPLSMAATSPDLFI